MLKSEFEKRNVFLAQFVPIIKHYSNATDCLSIVAPMLQSNTILVLCSYKMYSMNVTY